jgi:lipid II:glycine glycyltransferase (peptidoglycan interpeptide bridge formation enzyme)
MENLLVKNSTQWADSLTVDRGHLLQSWAWGELKAHFGWTPCRVQIDGAAAQILFRRLPLGWTIGYIPRGPVVDWRNDEQRQALFELIHAEARKRKAILLKVEPDAWSVPDHANVEAAEQSRALNDFLLQSDFISADTIQPQSSIIIDLSPDKAAILAAMKQKTRYNIRLAERKGVIIREGNEADLQLFYQLSRLTAARDGFEIHSFDYYRLAYRLFSPDRTILLLAEFQDEPLAALMAFRQNQDAYYFYGASADIHRNLMAPYLIQWAAMCWAKDQGCNRYDLWGIPNADIDSLEAEFSHRADDLWGIYRFKRGFGGKVVKTVGAFDYIYTPSLYSLYKLRRNGVNALTWRPKFFSRSRGQSEG